MGKFVISKRKNGEFQFNLLAGNGQVILTSEGYASKPSCMNGVKSVMKNAADAKRFEPKVAKNGKDAKFKFKYAVKGKKYKAEIVGYKTVKGVKVPTADKVVTFTGK